MYAYLILTSGSPLTNKIMKEKTRKEAERGGSVVTHETRIREVPVPTNLTGVFSWFSSVIKANAGLDFHYHDPFDHYS